MKKSIINSIWIYVIFIFITYLMYKLWNLDNFKIYLILWLVGIIINDILKYFYEKKKCIKTYYNLKKVFIEYKKQQISEIYVFIFINRHYLFPFILVSYMIILLIWQTKLFGLDTNSLFISINSNIILWITIISWILTIFKEEKDKLYKTTEYTYKWISLSIVLSIFLSIIWTYVIYIQTIKLGFLTYLISIISWLLIFLVWISILEDDENEEI